MSDFRSVTSREVEGQCAGPRDPGARRVRGPSRWLLENAAVLPRGGEVLDVACGRGRHALLMAAAGFRVSGIDKDADAVESLRQAAERMSLQMTLSVVDLESGDVDLGLRCFDAIVVFNYLHRPLMPLLVRALRPAGVLLYETFTTLQAARGHPKNPRFLLKPGELPRLLEPLSIERSQEGEVEGNFVASVVARAAG